MNKFIIISLLFSLSKNVKAQSYGVTDTLLYLNNIVANKSHFIGQPFSRLKDSLQLQVKYFSPNSAKVSNTKKETSTHFAFYYPQTASEMYLTYPHLIVYWETCPNADQSRAIYNSTNGWSTTSEAFYSNYIIKDLQILE